MAEVASIGKNSGKKAELGATIKQVEKELGQNTAALDKATAVPCLLFHGAGLCEVLASLPSTYSAEYQGMCNTLATE